MSMAQGLGALFSVLQGIQRFSQGQQIAQNPPTAGRFTGLGTTGGTPAGGFSLSPDLRGQVLAGVRQDPRPQGLARLFGPAPPPVSVPATFGQQQAQDILGRLQQTNPDLANQFAQNLNQQAGGQPLAPGRDDLARSLFQDQANAQGTADRNRSFLLQNAEGFRQAFEGAANDFGQASAQNTRLSIDAIRKGARDALTTLDTSRVLSFLPLAEATQLREEAKQRLGDGLIAELDITSTAIHRSLENSRRELEQGLSLNPNLPEATKLSQLMKFDMEATGVSADALQRVRADHAERAETTLRTMDQLVTGAAIETAGQFAQNTQARAGVLQAEAASIQATLSNDTANRSFVANLKSTGHQALANFLNAALEVFIPESSVLADLIGFDIFQENRQRSNDLLAFQLHDSALTGLVDTAFTFASLDLQQQAIDAQNRATDRSFLGGLINSGVSAGATLGSAQILKPPVPLAPSG